MKWKIKSGLADGWTVTGVLVYRDEQVQLDSLTIEPPTDRGAVEVDTRSGVVGLGVLRQLGLPAVHAAWLEVLRFKWLDIPDEWRAALPKRPGRRGHPDAFYAEWVDRYLTACESSATPVADLVAKYPGETNQSINRYLNRAGRLGFIADRPGRGKAGGRMTDKCRRELAREV